MIFNVSPSIKQDCDFSYKQNNMPVADEVDLRPWDSAVEDQGQLGSCVANAVTNAYELQQKKQDPTKFVDLSRLYVYYHARYIEKTVGEDYGVRYIKSALQGADRYGICTEQLWPYNIDAYNQQPSPDSYADACSRKVVSYTSVDTLNSMLENLTLHKPIVIGMSVYKSFMNLTEEAATVAMPTAVDLEVGGHAVLVVGYSVANQTFLIKNSFGVDWGAQGYARLPFEYVEKYAFDKWIFDIDHK
jgi:C1A family cysteine protease